MFLLLIALVLQLGSCYTQEYTRDTLWGSISEGWTEANVFDDIHKAILSDYFLNNDTASLNIDFERVLHDLELEACSTNETCVNTTYLGCTCMAGFRQNENVTKECSMVPCTVARLIHTQAQSFLIGIGAANSFREMVRVVKDEILTPILRIHCDCFPGIIDGMINCVKNYDTEIFRDGLSEDVKEYWRTATGKIDFPLFKEFAIQASRALCTTGTSLPCYEGFGRMLVKVGEILDNSLNSEHSEECTSLRRFSTPIIRYVLPVLGEEYEGGETEHLQEMKTIMLEFWCNKTCSKKIAVEFYTCCSEKAMRMFDRDALKLILKIIDNIRLLKTDADSDSSSSGGPGAPIPMVLPDYTDSKQLQPRWNWISKKGLITIVKMFNPARLCRKKMLYRKLSKNPQCFDLEPISKKKADTSD